jgi:hypothetical protein
MRLITVLLLSIVLTSAKDGKDLPIDNQFVDFQNIKSVLKKDGLEKVVKKKKQIKKVKNKANVERKKKLYDMPSDQDFWQVMMKYWLVKNTAILKWDFHKPDYGLTQYFNSFLKEVSELGVKYNILFVNSSNITHFGFPFGENEYLFVVSVPFIKIMDLSKLQISIMLYEDLLRVKNNFFQHMFPKSLISKLKDKNFYQKEFPKKDIENLMVQIDQVVYEKGFDFQQQYKVTKIMKNILSNNKKYWQNYFRLLSKIDDLSKSNLMYKNYAKIYPSPELQLNWINPTKN